MNGSSMSRRCVRQTRRRELLFLTTSLALVVACGESGSEPDVRVPDDDAGSLDDDDVGSPDVDAGSSDDDVVGSKEEEACRALCANEAQLACPNGDEEGCVAGCQEFYQSVEQTYPNCTAEIDARFACTAQVPLSSIQCDPNGSSPIYAEGVCATEQAALTACGSVTAEACNSVVNDGPLVDAIQVAEDLPTFEALGGEVVAGTYHLTSLLVYTGPGGASGANGDMYRQTAVVSVESSDTVHVESVRTVNDGAEERVSMTTTLSGTTGLSTVTCPSVASLGTGFYTATTTSYTVYEPRNGRVGTFELE